MKILVVDDEADVRLLFEQRFRREIREGVFSFAFAFSGEQALHYLLDEARYSEVVLILSDIDMPGMSGLELLRHIKQDHPNPPPTVMIITAYGDDESYSQAMHLGASGFLLKPIDFTELKQKLLQLAAT
ncbi:Fis family transcriptional regulator [Hymenobacter lapidarius]|uniref:Fis family transcriptional regulator n=1 Tax=Hymenobacter lapidarius TaxID=1908237 RepID=A0A1G1T6E0_9BACT|nr:response regulator [Hymenobacter lapidarius]OGX86452.1 Fis family transcriptional regulator [Hymenobacter lapidarius]